MTESYGRLRPLDIARDVDGFGKLVETTFTGELTRRGTDIHQDLNSIRRLIPIIRALSWLSADFRHLIDGFVWEDNGQIVGSALVQRLGNDKARWYIAAVAVHPDYRRRGIARRLLNAAIEHARAHGAEVCVLDVRTDNAPAYALYTSIGFVPYDGTSEFKLETIPDLSASSFPSAYELRSWKLSAWRVAYTLACAETPARAQEFLPVTEAEYRITRVQRAVVPVLQRIQGITAYRFIVEHDGIPVAALRLLAQIKDRGTHELRMWFDPAHRTAVAAPLVAHALTLLRKHPIRNTLVTIHSGFNDLVQVLESYGFVAIEHTHRLGLPLTG